jgi:hypothetical protein
LIQFGLGRLPVIYISPHIFHFFGPGAVGEYLYELFVQVFGLQPIAQVIGTIRVFIEKIFKLGLSLHEGEKFFIELLSVIILLRYIVLFSHT